MAFGHILEDKISAGGRNAVKAKTGTSQEVGIFVD